MEYAVQEKIKINKKAPGGLVGQLLGDTSLPWQLSAETTQRDKGFLGCTVYLNP